MKRCWKTRAYERHPHNGPFRRRKGFRCEACSDKPTLNGAVHRGSIVRTGGKYVRGMPKAFHEAAGIAAGDNIVITVERVTDLRTVEMPAALKKAKLVKVWEKMADSHQKEHVYAIE